MPEQEDRSAISPTSTVADLEKALSPSATHQDSIRDLDISEKDNDYGEKPEGSDLEAQDEPEEEQLPAEEEQLPADERDRDAALSGGTEGRRLSILSRIESKPDNVNNIKSIPNGGLTAWLQVAGAWVLFLNTWWVQSLF